MSKSVNSDACPRPTAGGYYHYATGEKPCKPGACPSYETVLPKVKAYHDSIGVPFGHWQFDSWCV